ncbi:MAG: DM13 domain-containing protein [Thermoleophilaceae bacterium]
MSHQTSIRRGRESGSSSVGRLLAVVAGLAVAYAAGSFVLQAYVAQTRSAAAILVVVWSVVIGIAAVVIARHDRGLRIPAAGTWLVATLATVAIGYWTGFRDTEVDEQIPVAGSQAQGAERAAALGGSDAAASERAARADGAATATEKPPSKPAPTGPVSLATASFVGVDGHDGEGMAEIVKAADGERTLTFSGFDVDPGPDINVYLSSDSAGVSGAKLIGDLKGNKGDQRYTIPSSIDVRKFSNVVLYCEPFTIRVAIAELDV